MNWGVNWKILWKLWLNNFSHTLNSTILNSLEITFYFHYLQHYLHLSSTHPAVLGISCSFNFWYIILVQVHDFFKINYIIFDSSLHYWNVIPCFDFSWSDYTLAIFCQHLSRLQLRILETAISLCYFKMSFVSKAFFHFYRCWILFLFIFKFLLRNDFSLYFAILSSVIFISSVMFLFCWIYFSDKNKWV